MPYLIRSLMGPFKLRDGTGPEDPVYAFGPSDGQTPGPWVPMRHLPLDCPPRGNAEMEVRPITDEDYARAMADELDVVDFRDGEQQVHDHVTPPEPLPRRRPAAKPPQPTAEDDDDLAARPATMAATVDPEKLAQRMRERRGNADAEGITDAFERDTDASATEPHDRKSRRGGARGKKG